MLVNVEKLMTQYRQLNRYEEGKKLVSKWEPTGLLEGIDDEFKKHGMALLLENQAKRLIDESSKTSTASSTEGWSDVALPLVRRTFAKIVAQDLMSVQPMSMPSGLVFWLYFDYGTSKPTNLGIFTSGTSVYGNVSSSAVTGEDMGPLYAWDYTFTKNYISASTVVPTTLTSASWADFNYNDTISASLSAYPKEYKKFKIAWSGLSGADKEAAKAITLISGSVYNTIYRKYTTADDTYVYVIVSSSDAHSETIPTVEYLKQTTQDNRGDFESGQTGVGAIPEINIRMESEAITATTRKLKAIWTPEIAQDLNAYHSVDAEAELTNVLSEYIAMEIDMELIDMLWQDALVKDFWSTKVGNFLDSSTGAPISGAPVFYGTEMEWYQTLIKKITKVSNEIHKRTLRGGANWIVVGTTVATILESMKPGFVDDSADIESTEYAMGLQRIGTLNNRWKVYKNPYFRDDAILLGFRGNSFLETGAVYAPYIPLIQTPLVYDPDDFTPRKGIMTRYSKKMLRPEFYGKIIVRDLNLV